MDDQDNNLEKYKSRKRYKIFIAIIPIALYLIASYYILLYYSPENLTDFLGIRNSYLLLFVTSILGGFTTFSLVPYHLLLITLSAGGLNPIFLGILAAVGVSIGDSTSYFLGYQGRVILSEKASRWFDRIHDTAVKNPKTFMFLCFLYSSIVPESNDFITIPAGISRVPFYQVMIPLILGNTLFDVSLALLANHAYDFLLRLFS